MPHPEIDSSAVPQSYRVTLLFAGAAIFFGLFHLALLPSGVVVFNDDFGYVRSVVETISRGRPWTDDWLEPWSASLSVLAAVAYKASGSFQMATQGVQVLLMALGVFGGARLIHRRGFSALGSAFLAVLVLTCPTLLWKQVEFTALALYVPCLLLALDAADCRAWGRFALFTALAVASRQSALAWLAIPFARAVFDWAKNGLRAWRAFAPQLVACLFVLGVYGGCALYMNTTQAQKVMTSAMWHSLNAGSMLRWLFGALVLLLGALGLANVLNWLCGGRDVSQPRPGGVARWLLPGTYVLLLGAAWLGVFPVQFEHVLYAGSVGASYVVGLGGLSLAGLFLVRPRIDLAFLAGAVGSALLVSLRGAVWDYYFVDVAIVGLVAFLPRECRASGSAAPERGSSLVRLGMVGLLGGLLLVCHGFFVAKTKRAVDGFHASVVLVEKALRAGSVQVEEVGVAPFGYVGWNLYPYFVKHDGAGPVYIADFVRYLDNGALGIETRGADDPRPLPSPETAVAREVFRISWSERHLFVLRKRPADAKGALSIDHRDFVRPIFPLNDAEWRMLIDKTQAAER